MTNQIFSKRKLNQSIVQFAIITLVILVVGAYFGYKHYTEYQSATAALEEESAKISELKAAADQTKQSYLTLKKEMDAENVTVNQAIEQILPSNEDFTNLARELDKYFLNTANTANPMFLSNLSFDEPVIANDSELAILPLKMSFDANETSFKNFLKFIENSGDLNEKTRLLDIVSITFNYVANDGSGQNPETVEGETMIPTTSSYLNNIRNVSASVSLNAYFQKPVNSTPST
jgi:cell division protein FtsB